MARTGARHMLAIMVLLTSAALFASGGSVLAQETPPPQDNRPNIVLVLTDDQTLSDMNRMPITNSLLGARGVTFDQAFVTYSLCCPSRATILRGQYPHNTGILSNSLPEGAEPKFRQTGMDKSTVATWLDDAGYQTVFLGKYMNGYTDNYVPPGWDNWHALVGAFHTNPRINNNGTIETLPGGTILDQYLAGRASDYVKNTEGPLFMQLSTHSPHSPYQYPSSYTQDFVGANPPRYPSFNERDVSDKPRWLRQRSVFTKRSIANINIDYRNRMRAVKMVDNIVGQLVNDLDQSGKLDNTYIIFTSDNGWQYGEHRLRGKWTPYLESHRVPLLIRGPGVSQNVKRGQYALNNDLAPTIADMADVTPPAFIDGRSLMPLLGSNPPASWRSRFLYEGWHDPDWPSSPPQYKGMKTDTLAYTEYPVTRERELYNLIRDPYQLQNNYARASRPLKRALAANLARLKNCRAAECRAAEGE